MEDILLAVLKGGELVVDFAGEIYQKLRGDDEESESEDSNTGE